MCDTLCAIASPAGGGIADDGRVSVSPLAWFAKNSDRPPGEAQVVEYHPGHSRSAALTLEYVEIAGSDAFATVISRPTWMWGAEHGVNEHGVAIGNEKVYTIVDPYGVVPALTGMDLVRVGLERGKSAAHAVDVITSLLEEHGQGGVGDKATREPYFSSFIVADPAEGYVLETAGRTWAARRVRTSAAISNRLTLRADWDLASPDVSPGSDFDRWRNHDAPTGHADVRLAASRRFLAGLDLATLASSGSTAPGSTAPGSTASGSNSPGPGGIGTVASAMVAHLRDHGTGPWGGPDGSMEPPDGPRGRAVPPPRLALPDGTGITVCMHVRGLQATTAAMVACLRSPEDGGPLIWAALGSPCASIFVPVRIASGTAGVPEVLGDEGTWDVARQLREIVEAEPDSISAIREVLDPLEREIWEEAEDASESDAAWQRLSENVSRRLRATLSGAAQAAARAAPQGRGS